MPWGGSFLIESIWGSSSFLYLVLSFFFQVREVLIYYFITYGLHSCFSFHSSWIPVTLIWFLVVLLNSGMVFFTLHNSTFIFLIVQSQMKYLLAVSRVLFGFLKIHWPRDPCLHVVTLRLKGSFAHFWRKFWNCHSCCLWFYFYPFTSSNVELILGIGNLPYLGQ